ncbi:MAG TPA: hypothetical protein VFN30_02710 [Chitinophagaceae bacterium]|nr:hypothetical protein [Chitinophagaceae bacterium]
MKESKLERSIDIFLQAEASRLLEMIPSANHLSNMAQSLNERYYIRHRIETVKRIWFTSRTDAISLAEMILEDYEAARWWSKYIHQELNHDLLYLRDLQCHGLSQTDIKNTPPFISTLVMVDYIETEIKRVGSIAAVAYSIWVEWNSDKISGTVVTRAQNHYSAAFIKGSKAHVHIDINEDHYRVMLRVVNKLLQSKDSNIIFVLLYNFTNLFANYFTELQEYTKKDCPSFAASHQA